jgi:plasmid maintenance system antidote protein VapI
MVRIPTQHSPAAAKYFNMSADFWMNVQLRWELYFAQQAEGAVLETIQPLASTAG